MSSIPLSDLLSLSVEERIQLVEDLWDSIAADTAAAPPIPEAALDEYERRLAEHDADPGSALSWDEVEARIRKRIG
jgi:putative addiction module component (TIGR02574 family)